MNPRGVTATITGDPDHVRFEGAAVLRLRPHPLNGELVTQLGVPDAALGFRPARGVSYAIDVEDGAERRAFTSTAVWLERVQSSWWFVLDPIEATA